MCVHVRVEGEILRRNRRRLHMRMMVVKAYEHVHMYVGEEEILRRNCRRLHMRMMVVKKFCPSLKPEGQGTAYVHAHMQERRKF